MRKIKVTTFGYELFLNLKQVNHNAMINRKRNNPYDSMMTYLSLTLAYGIQHLSSDLEVLVVV